MKKFLAGAILAAVALSVSGVNAFAHEGEHEEKASANLGSTIRGILRMDKDKEEKKAEIKAEVKATVDIKKEEARERKDAQKDAKASTKAEKKAEHDNKKKENIQKFWNKMEKRLQGLINNQTKLAGRIEAKLNKMQAEGKDVAALKTKLLATHALISEAQVALNAGDAQVAVVLADPDPKVASEKVRQINKDILAKIKEVHKALVDIIRNTGAVRSHSTASPSPTPSPTPTPTPTVL